MAASRSAARRVTLSDVARRAQVDRSTVSLALRHQPRIPARTRERILAAAAALGYQPDPLLGAFNLHRQTSRHPCASVGMAFISDLPSRRDFDASRPHREALAGAGKAAAGLGFSVTLFLTGPGQLSAERLDGILQSRGIAALMLGALSLRTAELVLPWDRYCVVAIETFHLHPGFDCLSLDHRTAARAAVARLAAAGHRRIGFVAAADEILRLNQAPLAGYLLEQTQRSLPRLPPLLLDTRPPRSAEPVTDWIRRHEPTAIVTGCESTRQAAAAGADWRHGLPWTPTIGHAITALEPANTPGYAEIGARAAELLALRLQTAGRGRPPHRSTMLWHDA